MALGRFMGSSHVRWHLSVQHELAPTAAELLGWLDETAQIVTRMEEAITR
jgi:hypothetical protein